MKVPPPDLARRLLDASEGILTGDPAPRLEDVARMVGASRASLYYYFAGRDDLLAFLLTAHAREGADRAQARADDAEPPPARLRTMIETLAEYLGAHLIELPQPPALRLLVTEHRADVVPAGD